MSTKDTTMPQVIARDRERRPLERPEPAVDIPPPEPPAEPPAAPSTARRGLRPFLILGAVVLAGLALLGWHAIRTADQESTDDAQIEADVIALAPRVGGHVKSLSIGDNQRVRKGDVVLVIDDQDLLVALAQAEAELAIAQAQTQVAQAQAEVTSAGATGGLHSAQALLTGSQVSVRGADAQVQISRAMLSRAETDLRKAELDLKRTQELRAKNAVAAETLESAELARATAVSARDQAEGTLAAAEDERRGSVARVAQAQGTLAQNQPLAAQLAGAKAQVDLAHAREKAAAAKLELAKLQLSYTQVIAPEEGVVSRLSARPGQLVGANQPIAELVPARTYIVANFKETQIARMKPGAGADIEIDAYSHRVFHGNVESLSAGTGSRFSLLPPDNASGNFVKVVQRVPVRIRWQPPGDLPVRVGLSVDVTVHVGSSPSRSVQPARAPSPDRR